MLEDQRIVLSGTDNDIDIRIKPKQGWEHQYLDIMSEILDDPEVSPDRTGTGRVRIFGRDIRVDLSDGILPIVTTRKINYEHGLEELLWMIRGSSNIKDLKDNTKPIWRAWAIDENNVDEFVTKFFKHAEEVVTSNLKRQLLEKHEGSIGPMYGQFWRNNEAFNETSFIPYDDLLIEDIPSDKLKLFNEEYDEMEYFHKVQEQSQQAQQTDVEIQTLSPLPPRDRYVKLRYFESNDQLGEIIRGIKRRPYSARHVMSVWIPQYLAIEGVYTPHENVILGRGALAPCHLLSQFFVKKAKDGGPDYLSLRMYQRSCDVALGVATNLVFYSTLLHLVAHCTGLRPKEFIWTSGDTHLYQNHLKEAAEQNKRIPFNPPTIKINPEVRDLFAITREDIVVENYQHHPSIRYQVSV